MIWLQILLVMIQLISRTPAAPVRGGDAAGNGPVRASCEVLGGPDEACQ